VGVEDLRARNMVQRHRVSGCHLTMLLFENYVRFGATRESSSSSGGSAILSICEN